MSQDTTQTAPGLAETVREVTAGLPTAQAGMQKRQAQAGRFIREHGAQVVGGHAPVLAEQETRGGGRGYP